MPFDINSFAVELKQGISDGMPYDENSIYKMRHKGRSFHVKEVALNRNSIIPIGMNSVYFEIGNDFAETEYPYYHILEDRAIIKKREHKNNKTYASKDSILPSKDYGKWTKYVDRNGEIKWRQVERKRIRQTKIDKAQWYIADESVANKPLDKSNYLFKVFNDKNPYYKNWHYHYIERTLDKTPLLEELASQFGLKRRKRKIIDNSPLANEIEG